MIETFNIIDAIEEIRHLYWAQFSDHNIKFEILCRDVDNSFFVMRKVKKIGNFISL